MSGSILKTYDDSPIDLGKSQLFFFNNHESPQWPEPKMFWEKRMKYGFVQNTCTKYGPYA